MLWAQRGQYELVEGVEKQKRTLSHIPRWGLEISLGYRKYCTSVSFPALMTILMLH